jgi:hypothetical protein
MGGQMSLKRKIGTSLMVLLLCISVTLMSTTATAGPYSLSMSAESTVIGGGNCSDFLNGFTVGMGVASLFGCAWCAGVAVASKVIETLTC